MATNAAAVLVAVAVAWLPGCGSAIAALDLQTAVDNAGIVIETAAPDAGGSTELTLARELLRESVSQQDSGDAWASYYLALRAAYTADAARVSASHDKATKRLDQLRRDALETRLLAAQTRADTADTRRTIAEAIQSRAEVDATAARAEAAAANANATQTGADAQTSVEQARAEAELTKAQFLMDLATQADAAERDPDGFTAAQGLIADAERLIAQASYRTGRLKAIEAYAAARDTRLAALTKQGAERSTTTEATLQQAIDTAKLIGGAAAAVERAKAADASDPAASGTQAASASLMQAEVAHAAGSYAEAGRLAAAAMKAADAAIITGEEAQTAAAAERQREELEAMVKDAILRVRSAGDTLDALTQRLSPKAIAEADSYATAAEAALADGNVDGAVGSADRARALMDGVEQRADDVRAAEAGLVARAKSLPDTQVFTTSKGVVLRLSGPFFAVGKVELRKPSLPSVAKFAAAVRGVATDYEIVIEGHTDKSGDTATNQQLSKDRAAAFATAFGKYLGVVDADVTSGGYGSKQVISGIPPTDARNRRIEIVVLTRKPS